MDRAKLLIDKWEGKYSGLVELSGGNCFYLCSEKRRAFAQEVPQYVYLGTLIGHIVQIPDEIYKKGIWVNFRGDGIKRREKKSLVLLVKRIEHLVKSKAKFVRDA